MPTKARSDHGCTRQMGSMGVPRIPIGYERAARLIFRSGHFNIKFRLLECDLVSASFEPKDYPVCSNYASPDPVGSLLNRLLYRLASQPNAPG
jgi:hypothetical protein